MFLIGDRSTSGTRPCPRELWFISQYHTGKTIITLPLPPAKPNFLLSNTPTPLWKAMGTYQRVTFSRENHMASINVKESGGKNHPPIGSPGGMALNEVNYHAGRKIVNLATWNVRGLLQTGKTHIVERELQRCNLSVVGLSETHWKGRGHFSTTNGNNIFFSGNDDNSRNGVAVVLLGDIYKSLAAYNTVNDRIITIKLHSKPVPINIVQIYAPTSEAGEEELEAFYGTLEDTLQTIPNREITLIMGDFNAKVGDTSGDDHIRNIVGKYGIGVRNSRGERMIDFCTENNLTITNTMFKQHIRRLYTWTSPDGNHKNQIDYILIRSRWRSSVTNAKTLPGADCGSDHKLLLARLRVKLRKPQIQKTSRKLQITDRQLFEERFKIKTSNEPLLQLETSTASEKWETTKKIVQTIIDEQPVNQSPKKQHWMTTDTLTTVENRRQLKISGLNSAEERQRYAQLSRQIQKGCRTDKNNYIQEICREAQIHSDGNNTKDLFRLVRKINKQFAPRTWAIQNEAGEKVTDIREILDVWRIYCENLYKDKTTEANLDNQVRQEPPILKDEVRNAIKRLKSEKAPGIDGISAEIIKAMGESGVNVMHTICQDIWETGCWPCDWTTSSLIPLHKKGSKEKCDNYRLIALLSHASKVLLTIINERLKAFLQWQVPPEQAGFVKGRGTREHILNIRQIIEKSREFNKPLYMCFVDYRKAFDSLKWDKLWTILYDMGTPQHLIFLIAKLYTSNEAVVHVGNFLSDRFTIRKGVRQGCILSPLLFNVYGEYIMRRTLEDWTGGVSIGGTKINNLRYADDTVLLANDPEELNTLITRLETQSREYGLDINHEKTKIMIVDRENNNRPDITKVGRCQVVHQFVYLGVLITNEGGCTQEIKRRTEIARGAMKGLEKTWKDSAITLNTKKKIVETLIFPIFLYGAESWTMKAQDRRKIDAFEMHCWRRILRVPWTARRTNESVLMEIKEPRRLSQIVNTKLLKYFGHVTRRNNDDLERLVVYGKVEGTRPRGRSPRRWSDQIKECTGTSFREAARNAVNRDKWREVVRKAATLN